MSTSSMFSNPGVARLAERQMRNWEMAREQRRGAESSSRPGVEDFVCVSRQVGADGGDISRGLAERLGWPMFDREILDAMAGSDAVRRQVYESMDERDMTWWEEALRSLMQSEFVRNDYFKRLSETLLSLARQGRCVFLGRGADLLLPAELGFRVRLVAPASVRAEHLAESHQLTIREAEQAIERVENDRRRFFLRHFGIEMDDPVRFDITVNLARFSTAAAVRTILKARSSRQDDS